jgi:UDPglucose--hexose-1-phosphate uridylyltransferase
MPELRKDPIIDRWVIISTERGKRPVFFTEEATPPKAGMCPLCPGNENMTPSEVYAIRPDSSKPNSPNWVLRVVPNKFPALRIEGGLNKEGIGLYDKMNGIALTRSLRRPHPTDRPCLPWTCARYSGFLSLTRKG